jgi:hypothetical protein
MSVKVNSAITVIGIDIDKNSFHVVGHDKRGAIMLRQKWLRGQVEAWLGEAAGGNFGLSSAPNTAALGKGRDKRPAFDALCRAATRREFDVVAREKRLG